MQKYYGIYRVNYDLPRSYLHSLSSTIIAFITLSIILCFSVDSSFASSSLQTAVCPGSPLSRMSVGIHGRVTFTDGTATRLRANPSTSAAIVFEMPEGMEFDVIGGSQCNGKYTWWQLRLADGTTGWVAEGDNSQYFVEPLPQQVVTVPTSAPLSQAISLDATNQLISFSTESGEVLVVRPDETVVQRYAATPYASVMSLVCPQLSSDGSHVAFAGFFSTGGGRIRPLVLGDLTTGKVKTLVDNIYYGFDWSPNGTNIAYEREIKFNDVGDITSPDGIWTVDVNTGVSKELISPQAGYPLVGALWSPDGSALAFNEVTGMESGKFATANSDNTNYRSWKTDVGSVDWSPDSKQLVFNDWVSFQYTGSLFIANYDESNRRLIASSQDFVPASPKWSPNGQYVAYSTSNAMAGPYPTALYVVDVATQNVRRLTDAEIHGFDWSPDGTQLIVAVGEQLEIISLDGTVTRTLGQGHCPSWIKISNTSSQLGIYIVPKSGTVSAHSEPDYQASEVYTLREGLNLLAPGNIDPKDWGLILDGPYLVGNTTWWLTIFPDGTQGYIPDNEVRQATVADILPLENLIEAEHSGMGLTDLLLTMRSISDLNSVKNVCTLIAVPNLVVSDLDYQAVKDTGSAIRDFCTIAGLLSSNPTVDVALGIDQILGISESAFRNLIRSVNPGASLTCSNFYSVYHCNRVRNGIMIPQNISDFVKVAGIWRKPQGFGESQTLEFGPDGSVHYVAEIDILGNYQYVLSSQIVVMFKNFRFECSINTNKEMVCIRDGRNIILRQGS